MEADLHLPVTSPVTSHLDKEDNDDPELKTDDFVKGDSGTAVQETSPSDRASSESVSQPRTSNAGSDMALSGSNRGSVSGSAKGPVRISSKRQSNGSVSGSGSGSVPVNNKRQSNGSVRHSSGPDIIPYYMSHSPPGAGGELTDELRRGSGDHTDSKDSDIQTKEESPTVDRESFIESRKDGSGTASSPPHRAPSTASSGIQGGTGQDSALSHSGSDRDSGPPGGAGKDSVPPNGAGRDSVSPGRAEQSDRESAATQRLIAGRKQLGHRKSAPEWSLRQQVGHASAFSSSFDDLRSSGTGPRGIKIADDRASTVALLGSLASGSVYKDNVSHPVRCLLVGDGRVGKTSLLVTLASGKYPAECSDCPPPYSDDYQGN